MMRSTGASASEPLQLSSDVDLLQSRARKIADLSLQSTRRMVTMVDQSKEVGVKTMVALDEQNEKLKVIEQENDEIREEVLQAEENIRDMEKCCGLFAMPWKSKLFKNEDAAWKRRKESVVQNQPQAVMEDSMKNNIYVDRIKNDAGEEEMEENLSHVHQTAASLRNMAAGINAQVKSQNKHIDGLVEKVNSNEMHVKEADKRTNKLRPQ